MLRNLFRVPLIALGLLLTLLGCQTTGLLMPVDLGPGNGRVDRAYEEDIAEVIPAVFRALDDQAVSPAAVNFRDTTGETSTNIKDAGDIRKNAKLLKEQNILESEEIDLPNGGTKPFKVAQMIYKGRAHDDSLVVVIVRKTKHETEVSARIGRIGNEQGARAFLDSVTGRLDAPWKEPDAEPAKEKIPKFRRTLPAED